MPRPEVDRKASLAFAFALAGCATVSGPAPGVEAPKRPEVDLSDPGPLAERWRLPSRVVDVRAQKDLEKEALFDALLAAKVVYVAEQHDNPHDHAVQLEVIDGIYRRDPSLAIGMEMFKRPFQKWVQDYVEGRIDEETMLEKTQWRERWGFDPALYRPILAYAREHKIPILALNERDEITRQVAREGLAALDPVDRDTIPDLDFESASHKTRLKEVFDAHAGGPHGKMNFDNFYAAQVIWDETMAYEVAHELAEAGAPHRIVVLAGGGHIRHHDGIPDRAARRGAAPFLSVIPIVLEDPSDAETKGGDFLWLMDPNGGMQKPIAAGTIDP